MPVQFSCQKCRRRLSVTQRKRGAVVNCPKCGQPNVVPQERGASASEAMAALAEGAELQPAIPEVIVFDDVPELIADEQRRSIPTIQASPPDAPPASRQPDGNASPAETSASTPAPASEKVGSSSATPAPWLDPVERLAPSVSRTSAAASRLKPRPEDALLLLSRRAVFALAGLLFALSLGAFTAGYLIGRGRRVPQGEPAGADEDADARADPVALEGGVIYSEAPGQYKPDDGAVVIALPSDRAPAEKLPNTGLRPAADEADSSSILSGPGELGGALARANEEGDFQLVVPQPGEYYLLLISRHAKRPAGNKIGKRDLDQLAAYFADGAGLIGSQKYSLSRRRISGVPAPVNQDFGFDGK